MQPEGSAERIATVPRTCGLITTKGASLDDPSDKAIASRLKVCHEDGFKQASGGRAGTI
jgi:hypothetical protein